MGRSTMGIGGITRIAPAAAGDGSAAVAARTELVLRTERPEDGSALVPAGLQGAAGRPPEAGPPESLSRRHALDVATRRIVYEAIDGATGEVVYQIPDARVLRAYAERLKADRAAGDARRTVRLTV